SPSATDPPPEEMMRTSRDDCPFRSSNASLIRLAIGAAIGPCQDICNALFCALGALILSSPPWSSRALADRLCPTSEIAKATAITTAGSQWPQRDGQALPRRVPSGRIGSLLRSTRRG